MLTVDIFADEFQEADHPRGKAGSGKGGQFVKKGEEGESLTLSQLQKTGGQLGSNPGGKYQDPETGKEYYVKHSKSNSHALNELLASKLYEAAGAPTLATKKVDLGNGQLGTATEWQQVTPFNKNDPEHLKAAQEHFAAHAWLGNWDAIGLGYDNQGLVHGVMHTLDPGGALLYRAQGAEKGELFGNKANEYETLRHPNFPQAHSIFGNMTPAELQASAKLVAKVSDKQIRELVNEHGPGDAVSKLNLTIKLIARKRDIMRRAGLAKDEFKESDHPRGGAGSGKGGQFVKKGEGGGGGAPINGVPSNHQEMNYEHARKVGSDPKPHSTEHLLHALTLLKPAVANKVDREHRKRINTELLLRGIKPPKSAGGGAKPQPAAKPQPTPETPPAAAKTEPEPAPKPAGPVQHTPTEQLKNLNAIFKGPSNPDLKIALVNQYLAQQPNLSPTAYVHGSALLKILKKQSEQEIVKAEPIPEKHIPKEEAPKPPAEPEKPAVPKPGDPTVKTTGTTKVQEFGENSALSTQQKAAQIQSFVAEYNPNSNTVKYAKQWMEHLGYPDAHLGNDQPDKHATPSYNPTGWKPSAEPPKPPPKKPPPPDAYVLDPHTTVSATSVPKISEEFIKHTGLADSAAAYAKKLKGKTENALKQYSGSIYHSINQALREGDPLDEHSQSVVDGIDAWFDKEESKLKKSAVVFRGLSIPAKQLEAVKQAAAAGKTVTLYNPGYSSTSLNVGTAHSFSKGVLMEIHARPGTRVAYMADCCSHYKHELEMLLPRGTAFRVSGYRQEGGRHVLEVTI